MNKIILLLLLSSFEVAFSEERTCNFTEEETIETERSVAYSYTFSTYCCFWDWCRCYGRRYGYRTQRVSRTICVEVERCCSGYSGNVTQCTPICTNCTEPHVCIAPFVCACPTDWSGDGCTGAPQSVNLIATGSDKLQMSWEPPPQSILDEFNTTLYIVAIENRTHHVDPLLSNLTVELDSLTPYTTYNCCVAANTTSGPSRLACAVQTTLEAAPADEPQNMTVTTLSSTAVHVQWSPPLTPNGVIVFYTIYVNGAPKLNVTAIAGVQSSRVDGFSPNQLLHVSLSASTKIGEGPQTVPHTVTTHESVPGAVENVEVFARADYVLHVSWTPPHKPNGILTGYQVLVRNLIEATESLYTTPSDVHDLTISSGIFPYERYEVAVSASTAVGAGEPLKVIVYSLEGAPQSSPLNVTSSRSSATTASVEWDEMSWEDLRGWLVSYEVGYESVRSDQLCPTGDSTYNETVSVDQEMYGVIGLDPGLQYCVWVAGRTSAGVGPFSHTSIPWYKNHEFTVEMEKSNCSEWIKTEPETIMEDLKRDISRGIEQFCRCKFSTDYITNESLTCHGETLAFEGRVISTDDRDSSNLVSDMQKWLSSGPTVIARGEQLKVVNIDTKVEMNSSTNNRNTTVEVPVSPSQLPLGPVIGAVIGVMALLALVVAVVIGTWLCRRRRGKASISLPIVPNPTALNNLSANTTPSTKGADYEQPLNNKQLDEIPDKQQLEYELPGVDNENDPEDVLESILCGKGLYYVDMTSGGAGKDEETEENYSKIRDCDAEDKEKED